MYIIKTRPKSYTVPLEIRKAYRKKIRESIPIFNLDQCYKYEIIANFYLLEKYFINGHDLDNLEKAFKDAIQPHLGLDDNCFYRSITEKIEVYSEQDERIEFEINKMGLSYYGRRAKQISEYFILEKIRNNFCDLKQLKEKFGWSFATLKNITNTSIFITTCNNYYINPKPDYHKLSTKNPAYSKSISKKTRKKMSDAKIGKKASKETRELLSKRNREKVIYIDGSNLRIWREENNFSRRKLANQIGCGTETIKEWEQNRHGMSEKNYLKFKNTFNFDPVERFGLIK